MVVGALSVDWVTLQTEKQSLDEEQRFLEAVADLIAQVQDVHALH